MPPRPLDKYQLRETKRRLQGLDSGGRQGLLGPRVCLHPSPLRRDPFCGEHPSLPSRQPLPYVLLVICLLSSELSA